MRKIMLATPAYDGKLECEYAYSLVQSILACAAQGISLHPVWWPGEALVQHARNMLVQLAIEAQVDDILFVDADQTWEPGNVLALIQHPTDVCGAAVRKRSDDESYNVRSRTLPIPVDRKTGLWIVDGIGTGFLRVSREALQTVWEASDPYAKGDQACRMVFDVPVIEGQLWGEDVYFCEKLRECGFTIYLDPSFTVSHIGSKKWSGDFQDYVKKLERKVG